MNDPLFWQILVCVGGGNGAREGEEVTQYPYFHILASPQIAKSVENQDSGFMIYC